MIKITRFFYVHFLIVPLFVLSYVLGSIHTLLMAYAIVTIHELFHLFAALIMGVRSCSIIVMPFGMSLRISANIAKEPMKESLIALSGPLANAVMILAGYILRNVYPWAEESMFLYFSLNWIIMLMNLLPVLPLDGGRVSRAIMTHIFGYLTGMKIVRTITLILVILLLVAGIITVILSNYNISLLLAAAFLLFHFIEEKKHGDLFVLKELLRSKERLVEKKLMKTKLLAATEETKAEKILRKLGYDYFHLIYVDGLYGGRIISETQLIESLVTKGYGIRMKEIGNFKKKKDKTGVSY